MDEPRPLHARIESSGLGQALISALVVSIGLAVLLWTLTAMNTIKLQVGGPADRTIRASGLAQQWNMFAPPPRESPTMLVELEYADGSRRKWDWPGRSTGQYRSYHWGKIEETVVQGRSPELLQGLRQWLLQGDRVGQGSRPTRVHVRVRWKQVNPPGPGPAIRHQHERELTPGGQGPAPRHEGKAL